MTARPQDDAPLSDEALAPYEDCEESWGIVTNADGMYVGAQDVQNMARELRRSRAVLRGVVAVDADRHPDLAAEKYGCECEACRALAAIRALVAHVGGGE